MLNKNLIIFMVITPLLLLNCSNRLNRLSASGGPLINLEPLPQEYLSYINDPEMDAQWEIWVFGYDNSQPPREIVMRVLYWPGDRRDLGRVIYAHGHRRDTGEDYYYEFPSRQPFFDIVHYIENYPDIFFTYTEYGGEPSSPKLSTPDGVEFFSLGLIGYVINGKSHHFCIMKGIGGDAPQVPEIEHVINMIKTEFMDELFRHPE